VAAPRCPAAATSEGPVLEMLQAPGGNVAEGAGRDGELGGGGWGVARHHPDDGWQRQEEGRALSYLARREGLGGVSGR